MRRTALLVLALAAGGVNAPGSAEEPTAQGQRVAPAPAPAPEPEPAPEEAPEPPEALEPAEPAPPPRPDTSACKGLEPDGKWSSRKRAQTWIPGIYEHTDLPDGELVLTFDDGPSGDHAELILDELKARGWKATFFLIGRSVKPTNYHLVQRMLAEGHALGNHTWHHDKDMAHKGGRKTREYMRAELGYTQVAVDLALLAESPEDFTAISERVFDGKPPYKIAPERMAERWTEVAARHAEVLEERSGGKSPYPMIYVRGAYGYPYLGSFSSEEREAFAEVVNELGMLNGQYHRNDVEDLSTVLPDVADTGGVIVTHTWKKPKGLLAGMKKVEANEAFSVVHLDDVTAREFGCSIEAIRLVLADRRDAAAAAAQTPE